MRAKKKIGRGCGNCLLKKIIAFILSLEGFPILFLHYASLYTNSNILLLGSYFKIACIYSLELFGTSCWMHTHILPNKKNQETLQLLLLILRSSREWMIRWGEQINCVSFCECPFIIYNSITSQYEIASNELKHQKGVKFKAMDVTELNLIN